MPLLKSDTEGLLNHIFGAMAVGKGGWLITANLDFLRRFCHEPDMRALYAEADLCVADGMPLVWAASLKGEPLPERIAGSTLLGALIARAEQAQRRVYFLGGDPGAADGAATTFKARHPDLQIQTSAPWVTSPPTDKEVEQLVAELRSAAPDLLLVGLGSPKQEHLIRALRNHFPSMWMIGVGVSFSFASGQQQRAPMWMRKAGLEWTHRLAQEPKRLAKRYLVHDLPFAFELFGRVLLERTKGGTTRP